MRSRCIWIPVVLGLVLSTAWADEQRSNNVLDNRFTFYGGIQIYHADGEFSSIRDGRDNISVDMDDLDLDKNYVSPIFGALFTFGKRFNVHFDYFGYHDDGKETVDFYLEFDDAVIPVNARVDSSFDLDVYAVNLAYSFYYSERARFGVGLGAHIADMDLRTDLYYGTAAGG